MGAGGSERPGAEPAASPGSTMTYSKASDEVTGRLRRKRLDERAFLLRQLEIAAALAGGDP